MTLSGTAEHEIARWHANWRDAIEWEGEGELRHRGVTGGQTNRASTSSRRWSICFSLFSIRVIVTAIVCELLQPILTNAPRKSGAIAAMALIQGAIHHSAAAPATRMGAGACCFVH